jgi:hypothetical protein
MKNNRKIALVSLLASLLGGCVLDWDRTGPEETTRKNDFVNNKKTALGMVLEFQGYNGWVTYDKNSYENINGAEFDRDWIKDKSKSKVSSDAYAREVFYGEGDRIKQQGSLAAMAALGVREVRIILAPRFSGFLFQNIPGRRAQIDEALVNAIGNEFLPDIVRSCHAMGLRPNIQFLTHELHVAGVKYEVKDGEEKVRTTFWPEAQYPYRNYDLSYAHLDKLGQSEGGPEALGSDLAKWMNKIVNAVESKVPGMVSYWGFYAEVPTHVQLPLAPSQVLTDAEVSLRIVRRLAKEVQLVKKDPGRVSFGPLHAKESAPLASALSQEGVSPGFAFLSLYPEDGYNVLPASISLLRASFPNAQLDLDFGIPFCKLGEPNQRKSLQQQFQLLTAEKVPHVFQWKLNDYWPAANGCSGPNSDASRFGFTSSLREKPREALGWASEYGSALPKGDFEEADNTQGWEVLSSPSFVLHQRSYGGATGSGFLRVEALAEGLYTVCSPEFPLKGNRAFVHAYVRGGAQRSVLLHTRDQRGATWQQNLEPLKVSLNSGAAWNMESIQTLTEPFVFDLPPGTQEARLCFSMVAPPGTSPNDRHIMDIDTVAVSAAEGKDLQGPFVRRVTTTGQPLGSTSSPVPAPTPSSTTGAPPTQTSSPPPSSAPAVSSCLCDPSKKNFCLYEPTPDCPMTLPGHYCNPNGKGPEQQIAWVMGWHAYKAACGDRTYGEPALLEPLNACPCVGQPNDNLCYYPKTPECPWTQQNGTCTEEAQWQSGWHAYGQVCQR